MLYFKIIPPEVTKTGYKRVLLCCDKSWICGFEHKTWSYWRIMLKLYRYAIRKHTIRRGDVKKIVRDEIRKQGE